MPATARQPFERFDASLLSPPGLLPEPVTILFFEKLLDDDSDGIVLEFSNTGDIQAAFDLAVTDHVSEDITRCRVDGVVYATTDPFAGDYRNRRELLTASTLQELRTASYDRMMEL